MKKIVTVVLSAVMWLGFAGLAMAKGQKSVGVGVGMLSGSMKLAGGGSVTSTSPLLDLDLMFHRKWMSWGLGLRNRSAKSPVGDLKYNGGTVLLGYYSNKNKSSKLGWHILGGIGAGSLSGISSGYKASNMPTNVEAGLGLDVLLKKRLDNSVQRPAADVLSLDIRTDGFGIRVLPVNAPKGTKPQFLGMDGLALAIKFTHYFAFK